MSLASLLDRNEEFEAPLQELFFATIYTADQFEKRFAEFLKPFGLTTCQYDILAILQDAGGKLPTGEISSRLVKQTTALPAYVERLVKAGFVHRKRSETDRRQVYVNLTDEGANVMQKINDSLANWKELLIGHLTQPEAEAAIKTLKKAAVPKPI